MNTVIFYGVGVLLPLIIAGGISFISALRKPEWSEDFGDNRAWRKLGLISTTASLVAIVINLYGSSAFVNYNSVSSVLHVWAVTVLIAILTTATVQSVATDMKLRLVDRKMLNASTLVSVPFAALAYSVSGWLKIDLWVTLGVSVGMLLFAAFVYIFVFSIGASDARALALVAVAALPVLGWSGYIWATLAAGVFFMITGFTVAFVKRSVRESFPAVPMLLGPYCVFAVLSSLIFLPALITLPNF